MAGIVKSFRLNGKMVEIIGELRESTDAFSDGEVVRDALFVYRRLVRAKSEGVRFLQTSAPLATAFKEPELIQTYDPFSP